MSKSPSKFNAPAPQPKPTAAPVAPAPTLPPTGTLLAYVLPAEGLNGELHSYLYKGIIHPVGGEPEVIIDGDYISHVMAVLGAEYQRRVNA